MKTRLDLSYRTLPGEGGCLVLFHGMLTSHHYFSRPLAGRWSACRAVIPDLLGFGDSRKPEIGYTLEEHLEPLRDLVEAEGRPAPLLLGGHSLGAALAVALAAGLPFGAVAGLVLLNLPRFTSAARFHATLQAGSPHYRRAAEELDACGESALPERGEDLIRRFADLLPMPLRVDSRLPTARALGGTALHCLYEFRLDPHLDRVKDLPMLLVHGGEDPVAPARFAEERLPDLPRARWVLLEDAGHHLLHTHAERVIGEMAAFVDALRG